MKHFFLFLFIIGFVPEFAQASYKILYANGGVGIIKSAAPNSSWVSIQIPMQDKWTQPINDTYHKDDIAWFYLEDSLFKRINEMNKIRVETATANAELNEILKLHQARVESANKHLLDPNLTSEQKAYLIKISDENQKKVDQLSEQIKKSENDAEIALQVIRDQHKEEIKEVYTNIDVALSKDEITLVEGHNNIKPIKFFTDLKKDIFFDDTPLRYKATCQIFSHANPKSIYMSVPVYANHISTLKDHCRYVVNGVPYNVDGQIGDATKPDKDVMFVTAGYTTKDGKRIVKRLFRNYSESIFKELGTFGPRVFVQEFYTYEIPD